MHERNLREEAIAIVRGLGLMHITCGIKVKEVPAPRPAWGVWVKLVGGNRGRRVATLISNEYIGGGHA